MSLLLFSNEETILNVLLSSSSSSSPSSTTKTISIASLSSSPIMFALLTIITTISFITAVMIEGSVVAETTQRASTMAVNPDVVSKFQRQLLVLVIARVNFLFQNFFIKSNIGRAVDFPICIFRHLKMNLEFPLGCPPPSTRCPSFVYSFMIFKWFCRYFFVVAYFWS